MFKRQKILMGLLEQFGGELSRTRLQKLLFLYGERSGSAAYEFIPYKFGCFSFQAAADCRKLAEKGLLVEGDSWKLDGTTGRYLDALDYVERQTLWDLEKRFGSMTQRELVRHVYLSYPYYATRSEIAEDYLDPKELETVACCVPQAEGQGVCSIGYEGLSLEGYLNKLMRHGAQVVCDVRKNPLSRKFGFSKRTLSSALEYVGIEYRHFPALGIVSDKRQALNTQADYDALFAEYERTTLKTADDAVEEIAGLMKGKRIALLCYEKLPEQCHRTRVLKAVLKKHGKVCPVYWE